MERGHWSSVREGSHKAGWGLVWCQQGWEGSGLWLAASKLESESMAVLDVCWGCSVCWQLHKAWPPQSE